MNKSVGKGNRIAPWRFLLFFALLAAGQIAAIPALGWAQGSLIAFDIAAIVFIITTMPILRYDADTLRAVAVRSDANRIMLLALSALMTAVVLAAIVVELGNSDSLAPEDKILIAASLAIVWLFANAVYTLHYAHLFYTADDKGKDCGGIVFPGTKEPLFADFIYFAYTLGVAVQTSDVQVTERRIRNVVTVHCVIGFFFNLGVLALTINVLGSR